MYLLFANSRKCLTLRQLLQHLAWCPAFIHDKPSLGTLILEDINSGRDPWILAALGGLQAGLESTRWCLLLRNHDRISSLPLPSYFAERLWHLSAPTY